MSTDYTILSAPRISLAAFSAVLRNAGSPAAGEAAGIYQAFVDRGVDPAIGLAIFQHESGFGKAGVAAQTHSIGNLRYYGQPGASKYQTRSNGSFAAFSSWTAGARAAAALIGGSSYAGSSHYNTARTFPFRWAPSADHNSPASYGASIVAAVSAWSGGKGTIQTTVTGASKAKSSAKVSAHVSKPGLGTYARSHKKAVGAEAGLGAAALVILL